MAVLSGCSRGGGPRHLSLELMSIASFFHSRWSTAYLQPRDGAQVSTGVHPTARVLSALRLPIIFHWEVLVYDKPLLLWTLGGRSL